MPGRSYIFFATECAEFVEYSEDLTMDTRDNFISARIRLEDLCI